MARTRKITRREKIAKNGEITNIRSRYAEKQREKNIANREDTAIGAAFAQAVKPMSQRLS